jgi:hypothetical protein
MRFLAVVGFDPYRQTSVPPTATPTVSAAGKKIPVLVSPVLVMLGAAALPSAAEIGELALRVVNEPAAADAPPITAPSIVPLRQC